MPRTSLFPFLCTIFVSLMINDKINCSISINVIHRTFRESSNTSFHTRYNTDSYTSISLILFKLPKRYVIFTQLVLEPQNAAVDHVHYVR